MNFSLLYKKFYTLVFIYCLKMIKILLKKFGLRTWCTKKPLDYQFASDKLLFFLQAKKTILTFKP